MFNQYPLQNTSLKATDGLNCLTKDFIDTMPIIFEDNLLCGDEIVLLSKNVIDQNNKEEDTVAETPLKTFQEKESGEKIKIIADEKLSDITSIKKVTLSKCRKIPANTRVNIFENRIDKVQPSTSGLHTEAKRRSSLYHYKNDDEILKDLMDHLTDS